MDKRKLLTSILAGFMALVMLLGLVAGFLPTKASALSSSELKAQINAMKEQNAGLQAQIQNLRGQISENTDEIARMVAEKNLIDQEIFVLFQQIANINNQIAAYNLLIADKQDELTAAEAKFNQLLQDNKQRIQAMEEEGEITYWSVLFQANSFADLLDRFNMVQEIAAADQRRLKELNAAAKVVADAKAELQEEKIALEETKDTLDQTQQNMETKRQEADALLAELVDRGMEYEALVESSEAAQAQLMLQIASKEVEYDAALYREWLATSVPPTTLPLPPSQTEPPQATQPAEPGETTAPAPETQPGETTAPTEAPTQAPTEAPTQPAAPTWSMPIYGAILTSAFGLREDPVYGGTRTHYGVDLAAAEGTPIYATRAGVVINANWDGDCGNYIQIDHGDGYRSIYMHMSGFAVGYGQYVGQGQLIGYCGSTGKSTGPHLHFGISQWGSYVNPAYYIPI